MNQKQILIKIIEKLVGKRDLAEGILILVQNADENDQVIGSVSNIISKSIKQIKSKEIQNLLEKSIERIKKIKEIERQQEESTEDIEAILDQI